MNVLSLFDGMSCGQIALNRAGIKYDNYYASEIDKHAIKVTQANYPNTIQLGDITQWHTWDLPKIDLIIGGSPCQGFSFAGKQLNFDDPRSKLFFVFTDIVKHYAPRYFLLENVKMKKESEQVITETMGVEPVMIDSALVSAQSRKRLYWTNIPNVTQPVDKGIVLRDILETDKTILESYRTTISRKQIIERGNYNSEYVNDPSVKSRTLRAAMGMGGSKAWVQCSILNDSRALTPLECERLQTVPDNYTNHVCKSSRYKAIGNGWTVDVIAHIFKGLTHEGIDTNKPTTITG